ncbi:nitronate monooxygenase [Streptomyces sp. 4503]|uniref:Nitronate monooxygenase n=1 Tax=Streptomyces niphimycinicus TaxID=2842201 RepID=A0ABS6CUF5_9ACTN|nr:nitronate monooxygenase [Streptomyces niphimycinicus]
MATTPPALRTRFTELVGCTVPVQQAGMGWVSGVDLAAAVSEAGGLGMVGRGARRVAGRLGGGGTGGDPGRRRHEDRTRRGRDPRTRHRRGGPPARGAPRPGFRLTA